MDNASRTNDQLFLLYFILGTYLGPDIVNENPKKSALRRIAQGFLPYTADQLAGSFIRTSEIERLYYYVLRQADPSLVLPVPLFYQFLDGSINFTKLSDLFPPGLHRLVRLNNGYNVIENIAFVDDPDVSYISFESSERFKRLSGLQHILFDGDSTGLASFLASGDVAALPPFLAGEYLNDVAAVQGIPQPENPQQPAFGALRCYETPDHNESNRDTNSEDFDHGMLVFPTLPSKEELEEIVGTTKRGCAITGSAANGQIGPVLGLLDIGESEDAYLFRISLPGVKRDESLFNCEVESDGKVIIKGVTTDGEKTVKKCSQLFEMQSHNLCPSGHFSLSFKLPGPVNPQEFSGTFCIDAILEGIVMKDQQNRQTA